MSLDKEFTVGEDVKQIITDVVKKNNWEPVLDVKYHPGCEVGDGYASKHIGVEIIKSNESIWLFVKHSLDSNAAEGWSIDKYYSNEIYFYRTVYPAYLSFISEKGVQNGFKNAPKCFMVSPKNIIVLENIKIKGYALFDRRQIMDEGHIILVLKAFAKLHAASFAFKDQRREAHKKLLEDWDGDHFTNLARDSAGIRWYFDIIQDALDKLDPEEDKRILEKCDVDVLVNSVIDVVKNCNEYSVITQGDCWCNNILFQYENDNPTKPIDVMIVDWQMLRPASPAIDVSHFLYTIASQESLARLDSHLEVYYAEL
ncbi:phosphotransferase, partial [Oryctes borbonicus]